MSIISFDTGLKTYDLTDECQVRFNPTDTGFIEKVYNAIEAVDVAIKKYEPKVTAAEPGAELFNVLHEYDNVLCGIADGLFNIPVSDAVFAEVRPSALGDNGLPICLNLILAIYEECDAKAIERKGRQSKTVEKYTKKYHK